MMISSRYFGIFGLLIGLSQSSPLDMQKALNEIVGSTSQINSIPGGSTFQFCPESNVDTDLFAIDRVVWDPSPPRISRDQKLYVYGTFAAPIPWDAPGTGEIYIPEWHDPYSPASNYTQTGPFCTWMNYIYQTDEERGTHKVCDGAAGGNYSGPAPGPGVLFSEDILFWPLPDGEYHVKLDAMMPEQDDGSLGHRIFCLEATAYLDY